MPESKAGKRYARALFSLANDKDEVDRVLQDLRAIRTLLLESDDLRRFVKHPALPEEKQKDVLHALFGSRVAPVTERFLQFLVDRRRVAILEDVCHVYEDLVYDARNIQRISIECAYPLREDQLETIKTRMGTRYGKEIEVAVTNEESLLAGFRIRVGDEVHDYSVRGKLDGLRIALMT
jgi:F-type H+-transporting ATPase subunit delta